jgi:hypothetical protein
VKCHATVSTTLLEKNAKNAKRFILIAHGVVLAPHQQMNVLPATATIMHVDVGLTWNSINFQEECPEEFA